MYVVIGATGQTGSAVVNTLLSRGRRTRAVLRDEKKAGMWRCQGAEIAIAEVTDVEALTKAFSGAAAVYIINPPAYGDLDLFARARQVHSALIDAAERANVGRLVALSSIGAQHETGTGNIGTTHDLESRIADYRGAATILRASNFMENWGWSMRPVLKQGVLPSMFQPLDQKLPMQSAADVGETAALLMIENGAHRRLVELHGPEETSPNDAAALLTEIFGKPVLAVAPPPETWPDFYRSQGYPDVTVNSFCEMFEGFNTGRIIFEGTHEIRYGRTVLKSVLERLVSELRVQVRPNKKEKELWE